MTQGHSRCPAAPFWIVVVGWTLGKRGKIFLYFQKWGTPPIFGWFITEKPIKIHDVGVPVFLKTPSTRIILKRGFPPYMLRRREEFHPSIQTISSQVTQGAFAHQQRATSMLVPHGRDELGQASQRQPTVMASYSIATCGGL